MNCPEPILPCEHLLFHSDLVKIGRFHCSAESQWFSSTVPVHNHVLVITRQPLWWRRAEGQFRYAEPGAALFHRPGGEIQRRSSSGQGDFSDWFGIRKREFREVLDRYGLSRHELTDRTATVVTSLSLRLQESRLIMALKDDRFDPLATEEKTLQLLVNICQQFASTPPIRNRHSNQRAHTRARRRQLADRARHWLDETVRSPSSYEGEQLLGDLSVHLGVSVYHLCRLFKEETGLTLHAYRQRQRIGYALALMQQSRQDLTTLAHRLGFSSHSHFTRVFKSLTGQAPSLINSG